MSAKLEKKLIRCTTSCSNCGKDAEPLKPFPTCSKCRFPRYCSKQCQIEHWKTQHKKVCSTSKEEKKQVEEVHGKDWSKFADDWRARMHDCLFFLAKSEVAEDRRSTHVLWNDCKYELKDGAPRIVVRNFRVVSFLELQLQYGDSFVERVHAMKGNLSPNFDVNFFIFNCIGNTDRPELDPVLKISHLGSGTRSSPVVLTRTSQDYVDDINRDNFVCKP